MQKIPYQTQIDSTRNKLYLTPEFCEKVLRGLSMTGMRSLYQDDFPQELHRAGLFRDVDEDELTDLTYGELCAGVYELIKSRGKRKDLAELLVAYPFIKTSATDRRNATLNKFQPKPRSDSEPRASFSLFDPAYLNRSYGLCDNGRDARYFYWTRWMTENQFFSAAYKLTASDEISKIIDAYHDEERDFEARIQYIGEDLGELEDTLKKHPSSYDDKGCMTFQSFQRSHAECAFFNLTENFIIIPISKIYHLTKGDFNHEAL